VGNSYCVTPTIELPLNVSKGIETPKPHSTPSASHVHRTDNIMETTNIQFITALAEDWLECVCGNDPMSAGFSLTNRDGDDLDNGGEWPEPLYLCRDCGLIIDHRTINLDARTVRVIGRVRPPVTI
jgi:hypothetical protein